MKATIKSDGTFNGIQVFDTETGEQLKRVRAVEWKWSVDHVPVATVEVVLTPAQVTAEKASLFAYLNGKRYRLVEES